MVLKNKKTTVSNILFSICITNFKGNIIGYILLKICVRYTIFHYRKIYGFIRNNICIFFINDLCNRIKCNIVICTNIAIISKNAQFIIQYANISIMSVMIFHLTSRQHEN
ncbi:TPA: hypothetical protein JD342_11540 [Citrobacter freundii]|nr:hypothetical protein [Citrobacter freundii]